MPTKEQAIIVQYGPIKEGGSPGDRLSIGVGHELSEVLVDRGCAVYVVRSLGAYSLDGSVEYHQYDPRKGHISDAQTTDIENFAVIRDIGGSFRDGTKPIVKTVETVVPVINGSTVRQADDKRYAYEQGLFNGMDAKTVMIDAPDASRITNLIETEFGSQTRIIAKPTRGFGSKGIFNIDPTKDLSNSIKQVAAAASGAEYFIQSYINNRVALPASIKPENESQKALMEQYKYAPKELRLFWFFGDGGKLEWMPVVKLTEELGQSNGVQKTKRHYAFIDPDTTPHELVDFTASSIATMSAKMGVTEISGAIDFAYGTAGNDSHEKWWVMEGNFWQPVPPTKSEHPDMRKQFIQATAEQLIRAGGGNQ